MNTDAVLLQEMRTWAPGRYEIIGTVELDPLGGGDDFDTRQVTDPPSWLKDNYPALLKASDAELLQTLKQSLLTMGGEGHVVDRILNAFNDTRATRSPALLWEPGLSLARALENTHRMDAVFDKVATAFHAAAKQVPGAPSTAVRPNLLSAGDVPSFPPSLMGILNSSHPDHTLIAPIGGTQKVFAVIGDYRLTGGAGEYECDLYLVVGDDFGVDDTDVTKHIGTKLGIGTWLAKGLAAFWVLQHMRGRKPLMNLMLLRRRVRSTGSGGPRLQR